MCPYFRSVLTSGVSLFNSLCVEILIKINIVYANYLNIRLCTVYMVQVVTTI